MRRSHGPGFRFHPTDEELIMYYLTRQVMGTRFYCDGIRVLDVYNFAPWDLQGQARGKRDLKCYFFCPIKRKQSTGKRMNRSTKHGFWKATGKDRKVQHDGETVGMIKSLIFHKQNPKQRTNWVMHEYKLPDKCLKQLGLEKDEFVLCVIFEKDGCGPRNGAQYGGPYRDEDWDYDNDSDTDHVDALTQVHTDKGKSTVPNDLVRADGYCVGSSSRTLPSDVDQSVNNGFPLTPVLETPFRGSQLPLSDECGMFVDEIPAFLLQNEQAQDIGVDGDINCEPSIPANKENIFGDLEDLISLDELADSCVDAHGCDFLANQNIQPDDYMELADCNPSFGSMIPEGVPVSILVGNIASGPIGLRDQSLHGPQFAEDLITMGSHGPGFRFHPTNEELIMYYLTKQVMGTRFYCDGIRVLDVYNFAPWDLQGQARGKRDLKCYFFCPIKRKQSTGKRMNRSTKHGFWKATGKDRKVQHDGETVGIIKSLIFHKQNPKQRTNWVMHEYKLQDKCLKQLGLEKDEFVLCVIFEKEGCGPRNGAQYGGPYRDEDWDYDNDSDTDHVDALTQVHTDKGKSTVPNDLVRADGYCVGSSSRTLPSDVDQSVNNGFPLTPVLETPFRGSQLPLSDECGMLVDEIPAFSLQNEQAQDIGVDGDINCELSIPANKENIFEDLEDLISLDDLADSCVDAHGCDFLANQNIQPDDYMELADCNPSFGSMIPEGVPVSILVGNIASGPIGLRDQSLHGPQFAEDLVGLSVQGSEENESHMNQHYQTADGSIGFHGQEPSMNGQMDHLSTVWVQNDTFRIMQPLQSMPRGSPHNPS